MDQQSRNSSHLSIQEAAHILKVSEKTLRRWEDKNILVPIRTVGGHRRYTLDQLHAFKSNKKKNKEIQASEAVFVPTVVIRPTVVTEPIAAPLLRRPVKAAFAFPLKRAILFASLVLALFAISMAAKPISSSLASIKLPTLRVPLIANKKSLPKSVAKASSSSVLGLSDEYIQFTLNVDTVLNENLRVVKDASIGGTLSVNSGRIASIASTGSIFDDNVSTLTFGSSGTAISIGATTGTTTINNQTTAIRGTLNLIGNRLTSAADLVIDPGGGGVLIGTSTPASIDSASGDLFVSDQFEVKGASYLPTIITNGDTITDFTGTGLQVSAGILSTTLGTSIQSTEIDNSAITSDKLADESVTEPKLNVTNDASNGYILSSAGDGKFTWVPQNTAVNFFTDAGPNIYITDTTDDLSLGTTSDLAKLGVSGDSDEIQLLARGNTTQTSDILSVQNSSGTSLFTVSGAGVLTASQLNCTSYANGGSLTTNASGVISCADDDGGGTASPFQTTASVANLIVPTDDVTIGSNTDYGKLAVAGDSDEIQFLVHGNATQTSFLGVFEQSTGTDVFTIANSGDLMTAGNLAVNGGSITTTSTTANIFNSTVTTLNIGAAATNINIGVTGGTMTIPSNVTITGTLTTAASDFAADGAVTLSPSGTNDITFNLDANSTFILNGVQTGTATNGLCLDGSNNLITCSTVGSLTLQSAYDNDGDGSDTVIALSSTDDSVVIRNPSSSGTDSGYTFLIDQLNTGNVDGIRVDTAGTGTGIAVNSSSTGTLLSLVASSIGTTTTGISVQNSDTGVITNGLDVSDPEIVNAISLGSNSILTGSGAVTSTELFRLSGKDAALVDTNDAVVTAITGTGALNTGSITSGFGSIDVGADSIAAGTITVNGDSITDFTGNGLQVSGGNLALKLQTATDALSSTISSGSGLETFAGGVAMLQGCADGQILKWNETTDEWGCANDSGATSAIINVKNNGSSVGTNVDTLNFTTDFLVAESPSGTDNISVADDILNFTELSDSLVLDANTTITAGSALSLTVGNNATLTTTGSGSIIATDLVCADCVALGSETTGNYVASITAGNGLTGDVSSEGSTPTLAVGAGNGILSNANDVAVDQSYGFTFTGNVAFSPTGTNNLSFTGDANSQINLTGLQATSAVSGLCLDASNNVVTCSVGGSMSSFSLAGDSGSDTVSNGQTATIAGGTNGIDTVEAGRTVTLNLDTTEITNATFGTGGAGFTWTFDASAGTDTTIAFGNNTQTFTTGTATFTGNLTAQGTTLSLGNGSASTISTPSGNAGLTIAPNGTGVLNLATTNTGNVVIGNGTGSFQLNSSGGLNVSTGGALTGVASLDTISTSATALGFAGTGTLSSGAATALNIVPGTSGALNLATTNTGNVVIGNATGTFVLNSNGGLNVTSGGALTGVASLDTISTSATALGFAGAGTITSAGANALTLDSGSTGTINIGTGTSGKTINVGTSNSNADTINIGSALDTLALAGTTGITGTTTITGTANINSSGAATSNIGTGTGNVVVGNGTGTFALTSNGGLNVSTAGVLSGITGYTQSSGAFSLTLSTSNSALFASTTSGADALAIKPQSALTSSGFTGTVSTVDLTAARTYTFPDATGDVCLTSGNCAGVGGGLTGSGTTGQIAYFNGSGSLTSEASGFAWDATNNRLGIGTDTPTSMLHVTGAVTGKALTIFDETGDQNILAASASGTTVATLDRTGQFTVNTTTANADKIALVGNATGANTFTGTVSVADLTANRTFTFPDATGTVCLTSGNCTGAGGSMASFNLAGDTGSDAVADAQTATIAGGTNGIDTSESGRTVTLNLDATEISGTSSSGATTFSDGTQSTVTWTFNTSGATDTSLAFANNAVTLTAGTTTLTGNLTVQGTTLSLGNGSASTISTPSGNAGITIAPNGTGALNLATTNTGAVTIGNATGAFQLISNGGLNVSTGGALTGVASLDTISTSATALGFAGVGTLSSGAGTNLSIIPGTTGSLNLATSNTGNVVIGNGTGTFALTSNGGLNVSTAGVLTGVTSIDTIGTTATGLTFAGSGTIVTTTSSALTLDSGTTGTVNLGTGNNAKTINIATGTAGDTVNIATDNSIADTINIASALDTTTIAGSFKLTGLSAQTGSQLCITGGNVVGTCSSGSGVTGSGLANQITYWSSGTAVTGNANFLFNPSNVSGTTTSSSVVLTDTSLTTGTNLYVSGTSTPVANTATSQNVIAVTYAQGTAANTNGFAGLDLKFTNASTIAGNTEYAARIQNQASASSPSDAAIAALLQLDNADTTSGNSIVVTDALSISNSGGIAAGVTNGIAFRSTTIDTGINFVSTPTTNYISGTNFTVTAAGAATLGSNLTVNGTALSLGNGSASTISTPSGNAGITIAPNGTGTLNLATTNTGAVSIGNATGSFALASSGGLNVSTGGALTGVASIDTIGTSATGLTFAGAGTIVTNTSSALTLDSGSTGTVNLGTGNNAKIVNIATGNAGDTVNLGTDNSVADTINIASALDTTTIAGAFKLSSLSAQTGSQLCITGGNVVGTCASGSGVTGSGVANQIAYWSGTNALTGNANLTFDPTATTGNALSLTDTGITTGKLLNLTATLNPAASTSTSAFDLNVTNGNTSVAGNIYGERLLFTNNPTVAGNSEFVFAIQNAATSNVTDNSVSALLALDNADTSAAGSTIVQNAVLITNTGAIASGITNGINFNSTSIVNGINFTSTPVTNYVSGTNWTVTAAGAETLASNLTVNGTTLSLGNGSASTISTPSGNAGITITPNGSGALALGTANTGNFTLGNSTGTGAITTSDWVIGATGNMTGIGNIVADGNISFTPGGTSDITFNTAPGSGANLTITGLTSGTASSGICLDGSNNVITCNAAVTVNLQDAYDHDADTGNTIIALSTADDSLIFRNPAASGTDSTFLLNLDQLASGTQDVLTISQAGTGNGLAITTTNAGTTPAAIKISNSAGTITDAIDVTDATGITNAINVAGNKIKGTTGSIDYTNFDVDGTTGNITVAAGVGLDTNASGILALGNTTATTVSIGSTAATTLNLGAGGALTRAINIGTGTGADTINIGTGGTAADAITIGNNASSTSLAFTSGTGAQTFTSSATSGNAFGFVANALTSGNELNLSSTSTTLTSGKLASFDWSPGSATLATGDLFNINIGTNGTTTGNLFSVSDTASNLFTVSESGITANLPTAFTAAGDVTMAYDLQFTNQTSSFIKSKAPLYLDVGENFENNDLTLRTYNFGRVIADVSNNGGVLISSNPSASTQNGLLQVNGAATGKALAIFNETGDQKILSASASGTTVATLDRAGQFTVNTTTANADKLALKGNATGSNSFTGTLSTSDLTVGDQTFNLPDLAAATSATICVSTGNCAGLGTGVTQSGTNASGQIAYFTTSNNITSDATYLLSPNATTGTALSLSDTALTTGKLTSFTGTSTPVANTATSQNLFAVTYAQSTAANTNGFVGLDLKFTDATTIAGNTEFAARIQNQASAGSPSDTTISALLNLDNADTATGTLIAVTDGLLVSNSGAGTAGIVNGVTVGSGTQSITNAFKVGSTGVTTDLLLQNNETIDNDVDGTINLGATTLGLTGTTTITGTSLATLTSSTALNLNPNTGTSYTIDSTATTLNLFGTATALTFGNSATTLAFGASGGTTITPGGNLTLAESNSKSTTITSDLSGGARSTDVLTISQANDVTNNSTGNLLQLTNSDTGSTAALLEITQASTTGTALSLTNFPSSATGVGINFGNSGTLQGTLIKGTTGGALTGIDFSSSYTTSSGMSGNVFKANNTITANSSSTESGSYLNLSRGVTASGGATTVGITGDVATLSSTCSTASGGTCTDNSNILSLAQNFASATGAVLDITNAGTGKGTLLTSSSTGDLMELDSSGAVTTTNGLVIAATNGSGVITNALNVSDAEIVNAINVGANDITGTTYTQYSTAGNMTLDSSNDIVLDADGADVILKDAGVNYGSLSNSSGALSIVSNGTNDAALDTGAAGTVNLGNANATAVNIGATAATTISIGNGGALTRAINIGTGTGADTINIGTGGTTADAITIGNNASSTSLAFTSGTGAQTFTSSATSGNAFAFAANALTSGNALSLSSTATTLTSGKLASFDWSPGSSTTATGDLFNINIGTNGTTTGNLFSVSDTGSNLFTVSETGVTSNLPTNFTSAGDVSMAYDLQFTNQTSSFIKSKAPLYLEAGESFESNDLTLRTYNSGRVVLDNVSGGYAQLNFLGKSTTGDPSTCLPGDIYFNSNDATVKACTASNTWEALDGGGSLTGSGATNQMAYWTSASNLSTSGNFTFNPGATTTAQNAISNNSLTTTGQLLTLSSSATGLTSAGSNLGSLFDVTESGAMTGFTGSLASINASSINNVGNTGNALNINLAGAANIMKAVNITDNSTGALTNGAFYMNMTGNHTGSAFAIDDVTTAGNVMSLRDNALTTGTAFLASHTTSVIAAGGSLIRATSSSNDTSTTTGTLLDLQSSGSTAGTIAAITNNTASFTGISESISNTGLTTGTGLNIAGGSTMAAGGELINLDMSTSTAGNGLNISSTGVYAGTGLETLSSTGLTTGTVLSVASSGNSQTSGKLINVAQTGVTTGFTGNLLNLSSTSTTGAATFINLAADSSTVGIGQKISMNALTSGTELSLTSTSTAITSGNLFSSSLTGASAFTGNLNYFDWTSSAATATGDLMRLHIGPNNNVGNLFNVVDDTASLFSISESAVTSNLPTSFTAAGDVSMAYDLLFTNQTSSYIKSNGPLTIQSGESFENNNLTLQTFGTGAIIPSGKFAFGSQLTLTANSTTPSVTAGNTYITSNSSGTVITNFTNGTPGQVIFVKINDVNTDFDCTSSNIVCGTTDLTTPTTGDQLEFIYDGTNWNLLAWMLPAVNNADTTFSGGVDVAEFYPSSESLQAGDVISIDASTPVTIKKGSQADGQKVIGIISTQPGMTLGTQTPNSYKVALAGRVPVTLDPNSQAIQPGDFLAASSISGKAIKATSGYIIGRALEAWTPGSSTTSVTVFVETHYIDPMMALTTTGNMAIAEVVNGQMPSTFSLADAGSFTDRIGIFTKAIIANLTAGRINSTEVNTSRLSIDGKSVQQLISEAVQNASGSGTYAGNATISGQLVAQTASVSGDATVSGTLYADRIAALDPIKSALDLNTASMSALLSSWSTWSASASANVITADAVFANEYLNVQGSASITDAAINHSLIVGGSLAVDHNSLTLLSNSEDTLYIQATTSGKLNLLAGAMTLSTDGGLVVNTNATFAKDVTVQGTLEARTLGIATESGKLAIANSEHSEVASIDASGSATFAKLALTTSATSSAVVKLDATVGKATLKNGQTSVTIYTNQISDKSLIYITPTSSTGNKVPFIQSKFSYDPENPSIVGSFTVAIDAPVANDISLNWWIIN